MLWVGAPELRRRRGRGRGTAPPGTFFSKRHGGGAESLSLGHVIVSKRELRGSQRFGDHYKTQPGERVAATAAAAASPAQDWPGRAAAAAARTAQPASANLASSRHSQTPPPACRSGPAPPPLLGVCRSRGCNNHQTFPPERPPTALSPASRQLPEKSETRAARNRTSFSLPRLSLQKKELQSGLSDGS